MVRSVPTRKSATVASARIKLCRKNTRAIDKKLARMKPVCVQQTRITCKPSGVFKVKRNFQRQVRNVELSGSSESPYYTCVAKRDLFKRNARCSNLDCRNDRHLGTGVAAHIGFRTERNKPLKLGLTLVCQSCNLGPRIMTLEPNSVIVQLSKFATSRVSKISDPSDKLIEKDILVM